MEAADGVTIENAERCWSQMGPADWLEAFAAHPRIGDGGSAKSAKFFEQEISQNAQVVDELARLNDEYFERHGFIFIVFASGKSPEEMLEILKSRIGNDTQTEMRIAAGEQWKIMRKRLTDHICKIADS